MHVIAVKIKLVNGINTSEKLGYLPAASFVKSEI